VIREIIRGVLAYFPKPSDRWHQDPTYFFNRRSEMGFKKDNSAELLHGLFGAALYDLIYPKWWGGQGLSDPDRLPAKVTSKAYEPGTNCAAQLVRPDWHNYVGPNQKQ